MISERRRRAARAGRPRRRRSRHPRSVVELVDVEVEAAGAPSATIRPRPTTTSEAATAITASAKIWPSPSPWWRENAIRARFAAVQHDLEREQDDQRAAAQQHAERAGREQERGDREVPGDVGPDHSGRSPSASGLAGAWRAEDDAADRGDEQHDRGDLEREQVVGEEQAPDLGRAAERVAGRRRACESRPPAFSPIDDDDLDEQRRRGGDGADRLPARPAGPGRVGARRRGRR